MIDYDVTIDKLRAGGLIDSDELVLLSMDSASAGAAVFGLVGAAIALSNCSHYIFSTNGRDLKFFDIDKKTGEYLGTLTKIERSRIRKLSISMCTLVVKCDSGTLKYAFPKKMKGRKQKEDYKKVAALLKAEYKKKK